MPTYKYIKCPRCGAEIKTYANPIPTVDTIIELNGGDRIILIKRKNPPHGYAIPGGFVDYGERVEDAAKREALEETGLTIELKYLLGVYSDPNRDKRFHTISTVFVATATGEPRAGDDAEELILVDPANISVPLCFDHEKMINDYLNKKK